MINQPAVFRRLSLSELNAGYDCLMQTCDWLDKKGIRQWLRPLSQEVYQRRHLRGENYGLLSGSTLLAIVSLMPYIPEYWKDMIPEKAITWMATLAVQHHGQRIGEQIVRAAIELLSKEKRLPIYLDCRTGYLERFYTDLGFVRLGTRQFEPAPGFAFEAALMRLPT